MTLVYANIEITDDIRVSAGWDSNVGNYVFVYHNQTCIEKHTLHSRKAALVRLGTVIKRLALVRM